MNIRIAAGLLVASGLLAGQVHAECAYPKGPTTIPDGNTAKKEEMIATAKAIKDYDSQVKTYLACLEEEANSRIAAAGPDAPADQVAQIKAILSKRQDAALEELNSSATRFNEQVRV